MNIPFLTTKQLSELGYSAPDVHHTRLHLKPLNLNQKYLIDDALIGYHKMYALDKLMSIAQYWQGYIQTALYKIHVQVFAPTQQKPLGTVFLLHGYLEHSGIYQPMIQELLQQGWSVLVYDLPGHGLSEGKPAHIDDFNDYQEILLRIQQYIRHCPVLSTPYLAIGQSTGGAILMHHILQYAEKRHQPLFKRVLLLSPLIRPAKSAWWHNSVGLGLVKHIKHRVPRPFRRNNHNPEFLRFIRLHDPLQPREISMQWILAMSKWMEYMENYPRCRIPVWLAQGALDKTVDWQYNMSFVRKKFRLQNSLLLEEASHQLINERDDIRWALTGFISSFLQAKTQENYY